MMGIILFNYEMFYYFMIKLMDDDNKEKKFNNKKNLKRSVRRSSIKFDNNDYFAFSF